MSFFHVLLIFSTIITNHVCTISFCENSVKFGQTQLNRTVLTQELTIIFVIISPLKKTIPNIDQTADKY